MCVSVLVIMWVYSGLNQRYVTMTVMLLILCVCERERVSVCVLWSKREEESVCVQVCEKFVC